jgi:hypothetical protein
MHAQCWVGRAFEQEKAAELEELARECEEEKLRVERAKTLALEECRVRFDEERAALGEVWRERAREAEERGRAEGGRGRAAELQQALGEKDKVRTAVCGVVSGYVGL